MISPGIVNESLTRHATVGDLISRGLVECNDGTDQPWGVSWELKTSGYWLVKQKN